MRKGCVPTITLCSVMIFFISITYYFFFWPKVQHKATSQLINLLNESLSDYRADYPKVKELRNSSETINALLGQNPRNKAYLNKRSILIKNKKLVDYWKRPIIFVESEGSTLISSSGKNGLSGDHDDIRAIFQEKTIKSER